jgi:hypothetical protein
MIQINPRTFSCDLCKTEFEELFEQSLNQALGCAATVYETHIRGYYGSRKYDDYRINFVNGIPNELKIGNIVCDECISELIKKGICYEGFYL